MSAARARRTTPQGPAFASGVMRQGAAGAVAAFISFLLLEPRRAAAEQFQFESRLDVVLPGLAFGALVTAFLSVAEEIGSGSPLRLLFRGILGAIGGALLGMCGFWLAGVFFARFPAAPEAFGLHILARMLGWGLFGAAVGVGPGLLTRSDRRMAQGITGGAIGGALGGALFDYLAFTTGEGTFSRFVGYTSLGLAVGLSTAYAEVTGRLAWVTFLTGPQEGRTVLLHRETSVLGRDELVDVPLFGDLSVQRRHALIVLEPQPIIEIASPIAALAVEGLPVRDAVLSDGTVIQIGRHRLRFHHREPHTLPPRDLDLLAAGIIPAMAPPPEETVMTPPAPTSDPVRNAAAYRPGSPITLRLATGPLAGRTVTLTRGVTLGRETDNDLTILDPKVSRHHARIEPLDGAWVLSDLGSTNGTRLNGLRIVRAGLVPGDFIYVGDTVISVEEYRRTAPPTTPETIQATA